MTCASRSQPMTSIGCGTPTPRGVTDSATSSPRVASRQSTARCPPGGSKRTGWVTTTPWPSSRDRGWPQTTTPSYSTPPAVSMSCSPSTTGNGGRYTMPAPKPVSTERTLKLKYTKSTVIDALGLNVGQEVATLTVNQYGELIITLTHGPDA